MSKGGTPVTVSDFLQTTHSSVSDVPAWEWPLPAYEGQPVATEFFAANLTDGTFVVANSREDFDQIVRELTSVYSAWAFPIIHAKWDMLNKHEYWADRVFNKTGMVDKAASAISDVTENVLEITFVADPPSDQGTVKIVSTNEKMPEVFSRMLPASESRRSQHVTGVVWQVSIPLAKEHQWTTSPLLQTLYYLGFGIYL